MSSSPGLRLTACCERCRAIKCTLITLSLLWVSQASAAPAVAQELVWRDNSGGVAGAGPAALAVWIPIVGVVLLIVASVTAYHMRKRSVTPTRTSMTQSEASSRTSLLSRMRAWSSRPVTVPGFQQTRELTAEQLAGTTGRGNRRRRPNSTASVRSTRSLPLYMKEPGDQEVVVFRGREDINSESANALLSPIQEGVTPEISTRRGSISSLAEAVTPLLDSAVPLTRARTEDSPMPSLIPMHTIVARPSMDTVGGGSTESPAISDDQHDHERERGPAPPYREAVDRDSGVAFDDSTDADHGQSSPFAPGDSHPPVIDDGPASAERPSVQRVASSLRRPHLFGRSESSTASSTPSALSVPRLLSLFNPSRQNTGGGNSVDGLPSMQEGVPLPPTPPSPVARRRRPRGATVATPPGTPRPGSAGSPYRTHRPSHSGSNSALSAVFRTRSNTSASALGAALTSPSTLSLHSISSPLTHTVVRTEMTYPRSGPTPDQMKLLASVESFKRFGVPYGPDAIAFASTSRVDLLTPPPVFEEVVGGGESGEAQSGATISAERPNDGTIPGVQNESPGSSPSSSPEPSSYIPADVPGAVNDTSPVARVQSDTSREPSANEGTTEAVSLQDASAEEAPAQVLRVPPTLSPYLPAAAPPSQPKEPLTANDVKKILRPLAAPQSSYKDAPTPVAPSSIRSASRASSHLTFETAQEGESVPPTPALEGEDVMSNATSIEDTARVRTDAEATPRNSAPTTPKATLRALPNEDAKTMTHGNDETNTTTTEMEVEEGSLIPSPDTSTPRKSIDMTSIALRPVEAPLLATAAAEVVTV